MIYGGRWIFVSNATLNRFIYRPFSNERRQTTTTTTKSRCINVFLFCVLCRFADDYYYCSYYNYNELILALFEFRNV